MLPLTIKGNLAQVGGSKWIRCETCGFYFLYYLAVPQGSKNDPKAPDVVLVIVDTFNADRLGFAGHSGTPPPTWMCLLVRFAVSRAYATSSWTLPSTASILTGLLPHEHRVVRDGLKPDLFGQLNPTIETLADTYKAKGGYQTGAFINNAYLAPDFGLGSRL